MELTEVKKKKEKIVEDMSVPNSTVGGDWQGQDYALPFRKC